MHGTERFSAGVYLGHDRMSIQHILCDAKTRSVAYARTIMRLPNAEKFNKEQLSDVSITPWQLHDPKKPEVVFKDPVADRPNVEPETLVRRVDMRPEDV